MDAEARWRRFGRIVSDRGWSFATVPGCKSGFMGWAKMGPILGTNPFNEPGEHVWFEFGDTREAVVNALKRELGLITPDPATRDYLLVAMTNTPEQSQ